MSSESRRTEFAPDLFVTVEQAPATPLPLTRSLPLESEAPCAARVRLVAEVVGSLLNFTDTMSTAPFRLPERVDWGRQGEQV